MRSRAAFWGRLGTGAAVCAALGAGLALASPPPQVGAAAGFRATLRAPGHYPKAGRAWPIVVTATYRGRGVRASVRYEFLYGGRVVARRSFYRFTGRFRDGGFVWPRRAAGIRLTLRAVVSSRYGTRRPTYWVRVRR